MANDIKLNLHYSQVFNLLKLLKFELKNKH